MSITYKHIEAALGDKYIPGVAYVLTEKGSSLVSKLGKGYTQVGKIADELTTGSTEMFILAPPVPKAEAPKKPEPTAGEIKEW